MYGGCKGKLTGGIDTCGRSIILIGEEWWMQGTKRDEARYKARCKGFGFEYRGERGQVGGKCIIEAKAGRKSRTLYYVDRWRHSSRR